MDFQFMFIFRNSFAWQLHFRMKLHLITYMSSSVLWPPDHAFASSFFIEGLTCGAWITIKMYSLSDIFKSSVGLTQLRWKSKRKTGYTMHLRNHKSMVYSDSGRGRVMCNLVPQGSRACAIASGERSHHLKGQARARRIATFGIKSKWALRIAPPRHDPRSCVCAKPVATYVKVSNFSTALICNSCEFCQREKRDGGRTDIYLS